MVKQIANEGHKAVLDSLLLSLPRVIAGKMFGCPAYYVNGNLFACVYGDGVGVKVPEELAKSLLSKGQIEPFQPKGKSRMREWVQINRSRSPDYRLDMDVLRAAYDYVGTLKNK
jgi:TfoX/Sxy family transcriptional regulator of competence genes